VSAIRRPNHRRGDGPERNDGFALSWCLPMTIGGALREMP
jgi:hypothetical protein